MRCVCSFAADKDRIWKGEITATVQWSDKGDNLCDWGRTVQKIVSWARSAVYKAAPENVTFKLIKFILMELKVTGSTPGMAFICPG